MYVMPWSNEQVKVQIDSTESNIRLLTSLIHGLTCALHEERRTLARLWFMILPVGKLPTEVLLHIFAFAVESRPTNLAVTRERPPFGPNHPVWQALRLSQVCSAWRQIVIHSPRLWAAGVVDVRLDNMEKRPRNTYLALLQTLIDRSSPLPIALSVNHTFDGFRPASIGAIIQIIAPTTSRWRALKINDTAFTAFKETSPGPFTALEHLDLEYAASSQTSPIDLFSLCPRLRRLTVVPQGYYYMSRRNEHDVLRMPWPQITHLELVEPLDSATCRAILLQCVNVVSATLTTLEWDKGHIDAPLTTLPSLDTLKMRFDTIRNPVGTLVVGPFFAPLDLPALRSLDLSFSCAWPDREFAAFQHRCPNIAQIRLTHCPILSYQLISVLRRAPALTHLTLEDCENCIDNRFLEAFHWGGLHSQQLVPELRELSWRGIDHRRFADGVFEVAIRSRCRTNATPLDAVRLQRATLDVYSRRLLGRMQDLVEHGVSFI